MIFHVIWNYKSLLFLICTCKQWLGPTDVLTITNNYNNTRTKLYFNMKLLLRFPSIMFDWSSLLGPHYTIHRPCSVVRNSSSLLFYGCAQFISILQGKDLQWCYSIFIKLNNLWITEEYKLFQFYIISN